MCVCVSVNVKSDVPYFNIQLAMHICAMTYAQKNRKNEQMRERGLGDKMYRKRESGM